MIFIDRSRVANTPEQAIARLQEIERLREAISKQAEKVGTSQTSHDCEFFMLVSS